MNLFEIKNFKKNKKAQIWVETVVYTLIAFALMGLVLAFARPKIEEIQDRGIIEQSISILSEIDGIIRTMGDAGNQRIINVRINKGELKIIPSENKIVFQLESKYQYSEYNVNITSGNVLLRTEEVNNQLNKITLTLDYEKYNISTIGGEEKEIKRSSTPYRLKILNEGIDEEGSQRIKIEVIN